MVADVVLAGPDGPSPGAPPQAGSRAVDPAPTRAHRVRRVTSITLFVLGCVFSGLCLLVLVSSWYDDHQINAHRGQTVADVLSVSFNRTAVRFVTPSGTVDIPANGVVYPIGLAAGERVRVEYDTANPELVRVAGRGWQLAFLPVGTSLLACWALLVPALWLLRRKPRRR
jgi:hypothetical protein